MMDLGTAGQMIDVDGQMLPVATMLRRGTALAVDLCLAVAAACAGFWLLSIWTPLDSDAAKAPIAAIAFVAMFGLAWGRDRVRSPGRDILRLRLGRLPSRIPGARGRLVTVHAEPVPGDDNEPTAIAVAIIAGAIAVGIFAMGAAITSTNVFQAVEAFTARSAPFAAEHGGETRLSRIPRALLIGKRRAYVQISARWADSDGVLDFFLVRDAGRWRVEAVHETTTPKFASYSLVTAESEIPKPPS